jgi:DNA helicase-2/ATP-dependent DNA helicase PcrA
MQANNALDFDDILGKTLEILKIPQVLDYFHNRFQYFCVDEYQDTNSIQYEIIELLAKKSQNLCVVGDDWQGIYSWRGANIKNIINFNKDFPKAEVVKLEQNYRSTSNIINAANVVIKNNASALDKRMWTEAVEGEKIEVHECASEREEADKIGNFVEKNPATWAILYRTNGQSRIIEEALIRRGVPYEIIGGLKFYDRKEIKDIIAYLRIILTPQDSIAWKRIVNTPARKIGPTTIERTIQYVERVKINFMALGQEVE